LPNKAREHNQNDRKFEFIESYYPAPAKIEKSTPALASGPVFIQNFDSGPAPAPTKISDSGMSLLRFRDRLCFAAGFLQRKPARYEN